MPCKAKYALTGLSKVPNTLLNDIRLLDIRLLDFYK